MNKHVLIVGGGLAGLSAAAALTDSGVKATLLESRPRLGGRAGSFLDKQSGEWIDTCQHVGMGCCTNLLYFCRMVGIDDLFREETELTFIGPSGERCRFRDNPGPAPLHLIRALSGLRYLSWNEKRRLASDLRKLAHPHWAAAEDVSFDVWLKTESRTGDVRDRFWDVILVSALSETADRISVSVARKVFVDGFLANRSGWRVHLPTAPLDEIYGRRVIDWLQKRGAIVHVNAGVEQLEERDGLISASHLRTGERMEADEFVLAVPWHRIGSIVPPSLADHPIVSRASQLESAPISSVHLWFDRPVIDVPHAVIVGRLSQWVFARPHSHENVEAEGTPTPRRSYLQVVISESRAVSGEPQSEVIARVVGELGEIWPQVKEAILVHSRMVTERRAVFSPQPGVEELRPPQQSPISNLQWAGDWTKTGWPATMEGAVRSGFLAAENILKRHGMDGRFLQPDLPVSRLASRLFGWRNCETS